MKKHQLPVFVLILFLFIMVGNGTAVAQQNMPVSKTKVAIRKFSGFSEFLSLEQFVQCLNKLNRDSRTVYVKYYDGMRYDFVTDVKSDNSFPKVKVKPVSGSQVEPVNSNAAYAGNDSYAQANSEESTTIRTIGVYYDNEFSLYDDGQEIGFGTVILSISQPGLNRRPAYKKAVYLEDAPLLIEESLFDELLSNMFSYFRKVEISNEIPY